MNIIGRRKWRWGAAVVLFVTHWTTASPVLAQIRTSFVDAEGARVRYAEATAKPVMPCNQLLSLTNYDFAVISARTMPERGNVRAHCRVFGVIAPEIRFQLNLPDHWNERLYMIGSGGWGGQHPDSPAFLQWQERSVANGFVTVYSDRGHDQRAEPGTSFAYRNLAKEVDFGFRSLHVTGDTAKRLIEAYYDRPPRRSYFDGCSNGGREGFVLAHRFPDDFDGILAGSAPFDSTGWFLMLRQVVSALQKVQITPERLEILGNAVYAKCDGIDGLEDGVIEDPRRCTFDPHQDLPRCPGDTPGARCFTEGQLDGLEMLYGSVSINGKPRHPGIPLGAEIIGKPHNGFPGPMISGWEPRLIQLGRAATEGIPVLLEERLDFWLANLAYEVDDAMRTWRDFDIDRDHGKLGFSTANLGVTEPDLVPLSESGGKLIAYHGWSDTGPSPLRTAEYFDNLYESMPGLRETARLFMVPGMFHCGGGSHADHFDLMSTLIDWVEAGIVPKQMRASRIEKGKVVLTRPICAYPRVARYTGRGSTDDARNFRCLDPD